MKRKKSKRAEVESRRRDLSNVEIVYLAARRLPETQESRLKPLAKGLPKAVPAKVAGK